MEFVKKHFYMFHKAKAKNLIQTHIYSFTLTVGQKYMVLHVFKIYFYRFEKNN